MIFDNRNEKSFGWKYWYSRRLRIGVRTQEKLTLKEIGTGTQPSYQWEPLDPKDAAYSLVDGKEPHDRDYENNTWVRAPLAHFANHYGTAEATKKTWMGLNSAPQAKTMEIVIDKIRELTEKKLKSNFDTVTVFTGTGFKPIKCGKDCSIMAFALVGKVAVPHFWFKVLLFQKTEKNKKLTYQLETYLFPNEDIYTKETKLHQFHATLEQVYAMSDKPFLQEKDFPGVKFTEDNVNKEKDD